MASNRQYDGYQGGLRSMVYKFFFKNPRDASTRRGARIISEEH